jgi:hypothetical protein
MHDSRPAYCLAALALFSATFAGCAGGASTTLVPTAAMPSLLASSSSGTLSVAGTVVAIKSSTEFQIQGGQGVGYFNVYTTSTTTYNGAKPYVGENVEAIGTGTVSTDLSAATQINQLFTVSGPVVAIKTGGFQMQGGAGIGYIDIWTNAGTLYQGSKPYAGETVTAQGYGTLQTSLTGVIVAQTSSSSATPSPSPSASPSPKPTSSPAPGYTAPPTTAFMPSSWGKISAFQVFDDTSNGYITEAAAQQDGYRYSSVWGSRNNIGTSWLYSNAGLQDGYYNALETDESSTAWGAIGHTLSWWQSNNPTWVLYACTSSGTPTTTPAYVPGLNDNVPLDIHNPSVVSYQVRLMANYAHQLGYHALSIDEATFWQADEGVSGGYGCGIYENGSFVRRYTGSEDPNWAADVVNWVKIAHSILTTDATISTYHLKLIVNHPADTLTTNEETFLANVDADLDETGYTDYGRYQTGSASDMVMTADWAMYAQQHGVAVLMNDNWGSVSVGTPQLDYSIATYLLANLQAESLFASAGTGYGLEQWHSQYQTAIGAPCGAYYGGSSYSSSNPSVYYRRFANAVVVVNGGSGSSSEVAYLPTGHSYTDLLGRSVSNPLTIASNDGYVLLTSNGCQ